MEKESIKEIERMVEQKLFIRFGSTIEEFEQKVQKVGFLGTIEDFNIIRLFYDGNPAKEEEYDEEYAYQLLHLSEALDLAITGKKETSNEKMQFSLKCIEQMNSILKGDSQAEYGELLQVVYMTIFSRYNDNKNKTNNLVVTRDLMNELWLQDKKLQKDEQGKISISEIGQIYITYEKYQELLKEFQQDSAESSKKKQNSRRRLTYFVLRNIRNKMMHGDFENTSVDTKKTVDIQGARRDFKAKFEFDCLNHICSEITRQLGSNNDDILFDFEESLVNSGTAGDMMKNQENMVQILFPLYINSFIVYNFDKFKDFEKTRDGLNEKKPNSSEAKMLNQYYNPNGESFIGKIIEYNENSINAFDCFRHIRNSVAHNYLKFENGKVHILDFNKSYEDGQEKQIKTADFYIPYSLFIELLEEQSKVLTTANPSFGDADGR